MHFVEEKKKKRAWIWLCILKSYWWLREQQIWDDIGESEADKDRMLLELEKECLDVYRRKVDEASNTKARLHHTVAAKEAELAALVASMGELNIQSQVSFLSVTSYVCHTSFLQLEY